MLPSYEMDSSAFAALEEEARIKKIEALSETKRRFWTNIENLAKKALMPGIPQYVIEFLQSPEAWRKLSAESGFFSDCFLRYKP